LIGAGRPISALDQDQEPQAPRAVLSFGGFLGIGDDYPLPWQSLKYDTNLGGYVAGITEDKLKGAQKYANENSWNWAAPGTTKSIDDYYLVIP
jgi:hypothetical protein